MKVCVGCIYEYDWEKPLTAIPEGCKGCKMVDGKPSNYKPKPQTNADRIRAMSDEELAKWFENHMDCLMCPIGNECFSNGKDCANGLMEWLKQPAEDHQ